MVGRRLLLSYARMVAQCGRTLSSHPLDTRCGESHLSRHVAQDHSSEEAGRLGGDPEEEVAAHRLPGVPDGPFELQGPTVDHGETRRLTAVERMCETRDSWCAGIGQLSSLLLHQYRSRCHSRLPCRS